MKKNIIFCLIILIAVFFRFYNLNAVPPSASLDEASIGYNAYSILKTGADEYGNKFPILLRAYDDWRPAFYVYLVVPSVAVFGVNSFSVRLPSVILSILAVVSSYFLAKKIFSNYKDIKISGIRISIAEIVALLLAISPWQIYISRLGHEANAGLAFLIFAITFFLYKKIYFSALFFILSFISYQTEKIFIPIMILGILIFFRKSILTYKKKLVIIFIFSLIIISPFIWETLSPNALIRFEGTNVFKSQESRFNNQAFLLSKAVNNNDLTGKIIYNRRVLTIQIFLEGYVAHFNPNWLFFNPSDDSHKIPGIGLMFIWELPLVLIGFIFFIFGKIDSRIKGLILLWFFSAPIAASLVTDAPHAMRSYVFLPTWQIFASAGLFSVFIFVKNIKLQKMIIGLFVAVILISMYFLFKQYFFVFPKTQSNSFQYPLSTAISFVLKHEKSYNKVVFSNKDSLYQSYMFFLFYSKYDPSFYQKQGGTKSGGYDETHDFDKYSFRPIKWNKEEKKNNTLYIGSLIDFKGNGRPSKIFYDMSGNKKIYALE